MKRAFAFIACTIALVVGCSSSSSGGGTGTAGDGGGGTATDCTSRCDALATKCKTNPAQCGQLCSTATSAQLDCLDAANCDQLQSAACLKSGGPTGVDAGGTSSCGTPQHMGTAVTCTCAGATIKACYFSDSKSKCDVTCGTHTCDESKCF